MEFESLKSHKITSPKPRRFILKMLLQKRKKKKPNQMHSRSKTLCTEAEKYINPFFHS